ncbi:receptor-interacting serine/threonine-protein kinase 1 isoform X1 [Tachysurus fulvidraco]|uniref:receptor-interacting serine/threonine-protein kinase 1 isoform X1 n=1 Tax=Tachysurus fulvidraco TaxID=1234273 RepID=UPI000F4E62F4|nr:receptor-interacting serine/threonine-protein kinase 1 isoform X1 [Tachysurus fulvidraco]
MASSLDLMKTSDLIKKERLDYGGFGEVFLCYHKTLGHVVQKTVYTGPPRIEQQASLLEEGSLMKRLNHERVVKLLGVILEERDYSLVMELIPKGNLLVMLQKVNVPVSIKGRIVLEILEGMVYLTENQVIHKDLKPENILVDENFHIKIADLGLATCQTWSRLTREESRRQSRGARKSCVMAAGTLCYMAPEHLESINTRSTEKSDVYSFAIVVWVILTSREPYENAISQDQICQCVRKGDRPDESLIPCSSPKEIIGLMKKCWEHDPQKRPRFKESFDSFSPFYKKNLHSDTERDLQSLKDSYEGPLLEKLKSLTTELVVPAAALEAPPLRPHSGDSPTPLLSSDLGPVETSMEELSLMTSGSGGFQADAVPEQPSDPPNLEQKLNQEFRYHKEGSYTPEQQPYNPAYHNNPVLQTSPSSVWGGDFPQQVSSVQSWSKPNPTPNLNPYEAFPRPEYTNQLSASLLQCGPSHQHKPIERMQSWPSDFSAVGISPQTETNGSLYISQASGIQIGNNNTMNFRSVDSSSLSSQSSTSSCITRYKELLQKYEDHAVTDEHLELVRKNVGGKWKACSRKLGLTDVEIDAIEHDYSRDGLAEKVHQMLEHWKMKEGLQGCTVGKLCRALEQSVKADVLLEILLKSQDYTAALLSQI